MTYALHDCSDLEAKNAEILIIKLKIMSVGFVKVDLFACIQLHSSLNNV